MGEGGVRRLGCKQCTYFLINNRFLPIQSLNTKKKNINFLFDHLSRRFYGALRRKKKTQNEMFEGKNTNNNEKYSSFCRRVFNTHTVFNFS